MSFMRNKAIMKISITWIKAFIALTGLIVFSCISKTPTHKEKLDIQELTKNQPEEHGTLISAGDLQISNPLNAEWVTEGNSIYQVKCQACHKLTDEKLVGP